MNGEARQPAAPTGDVERVQRERQNYFLLGVAAGVGAAMFGCFLLNVLAPLLVFGGIMLFDGPGTVISGPISDEYVREYEHVDVSEELAEKGAGSIDGFLTGDSVTNMDGSGNFALALRRKGDVVEEARIEVDENTDIEIEGRRATLAELSDESPMGLVTVDFEVSRGMILATDVEVDEAESAPDWVFE